LPPVGVADDLQRLELTVGRVVAAEEHAGARAPSLLVTIDLGGRGRRDATLATRVSPDELVGRQVVCALEGDELLVLGARSHSHGLVLLRPDREVEEGSLIA
jgi:tRNA-binding EMAP/Myf-like protein